MKITTEGPGPLSNIPGAEVFRIENDHGISILIANYGCTVLSLSVPDSKGKSEDIVTGYFNTDEWKKNPAYFGSLIGRTCNRIGGAKFSIDGTEYNVSANTGDYQLHGGFEGFDKKIWDAVPFLEKDTACIRFHYVSADGEEGFPGNLDASIEYCLNNHNEFSMKFMATTDKATPVNFTNHCYFNLAGENSGDIYKQELLIHADYITETTPDCIPTGKLLPVKGTPFDFTHLHPIGDKIHDLPMGYDDNYVLRNQDGNLAHAVTARDTQSGRVLEIFTTEPGVQLYTSNWFDGNTRGKQGKPYLKHHAFALETQHFPDSMNHPEFPNVILRPGQVYSSNTIWRFTTL